MAKAVRFNDTLGYLYRVVRTASLDLAAVASAAYLVTLAVVPMLAPDRDVLRSHPEHYADSAAGVLVRTGYLAVAVMAGAIAVHVWPGRGGVRRAAAALLLAGGAMASVLAIAPQEVSGGVLLIGVFALALSPSAVSIAERDRLPRAVRAFGVVVTFGLIAVALAPTEIGGLVNRLWDALLASWALTLTFADRAGRRAASMAR